MSLTPQQERRLARFTPEQIELHRMVMKHIEAEPERWNQETWVHGGKSFEDKILELDEKCADYIDYVHALGQEEVDVQECGTTLCYAGWACHLSGYRFTMAESVFLEDVGSREPVVDAARQLLGLTPSEGNILFEGEAGNNDPEQMKDLVTSVTGIEFD